MPKTIHQTDILAFAKTTWDQAPPRVRQVLSRFADFRRVYIFEETRPSTNPIAHLKLHETEEGVIRVTPHLPENINDINRDVALTGLLNELVMGEGLRSLTLWYYDAAALGFSRYLRARTTIFEPPPDLTIPPLGESRARELLRRANLVITTSREQYQILQPLHQNSVHIDAHNEYAWNEILKLEESASRGRAQIELCN